MELVNLGAGPALHVKLCKTERDSGPNSGLDLMASVGYVEVGGSEQTPIRTQGDGLNVLNGKSLQCQYTSLSGRTYWTIVDFDRADNNLLIATRFYNVD